MKRSLRLGVSAATLAALAVLSACGGEDSSSSSDGRSGATARLELAIPSAVFAPKEEVAVHAVGTAEGYLSEEKLKVDVINSCGRARSPASPWVPICTDLWGSLPGGEPAGITIGR